MWAYLRGLGESQEVRFSDYLNELAEKGLSR
jgi:DUF971 family protein